MLGRAGRRTGEGPGEEFGGYPGCLADQQVSGARQPVQHPLVHRLGRGAGAGDGPEQLTGHPVRWRTRLRESASRITVPGSSDRRWHVVVQGRPDERMPESEAAAGLGQHADSARLVDRRIRSATPRYDRQVRTAKSPREAAARRTSATGQ